MISYISHVMTLANSIIGVSVLAMPFCFKQCGIILSLIVLTLCSLLSRIACHFLIKSAVMSRRRNYEFLAFHAFGPMGKMLVELLIIGFLIGTCIAFFVVVGDLGPQIIGKLINKNPEDIKFSFLLTTASLIILPLGLLKNIESLASICTVSIGFYLCLVLEVIAESMGHIFTGDWYDDVNYWRPAGILQCLPIFSMALFCQTQLFEIYESIPNVSLEKMNVVVRGAINICTLVYISVGFFGYVAFCRQPFSGNILMSFQPSMTSDVMKIGFVLAVIASFPLVIFPCRASLNSLLFRRAYMHETVTNYIPEIRFRCLTFTIIVVSLITGYLMTNIEFVLGLVGSTIGVMICLVFPAAFFITISTKNTNERLIAQAMLFIGMWIMILGTYANIYSVEASTSKMSIFTEKTNPQMNSNIDNRDIVSMTLEHSIKERVNIGKILNNENSIMNNDNKNLEIPMQKLPNNINLTINSQVMENIGKKSDNLDGNKIIHIDDSLTPGIKIINKHLSAEEKVKAMEDNEKKIDQQANENLINSDAIKKEELEIAAAADQSADAEAVERLKEKQRIQDTLEQNKIETMELLKEQKAILENFIVQKKEFEMDKKLLKNLESNAFEDKAMHKNFQITDDKNNIANSKEAVESKIVLKGRPLNQDTKQSSIVSLKNKLSVEKQENLMDKTKTKELNLIDNNLNLDPIISPQSHREPLNNFNSSESRGPILNALMNKTVQSVNSNLPFVLEDADKRININNNNTRHYDIPIVLKLINNTRDNSAQVAVNPVDSGDKPLINHRDILESRIREKRKVDDVIAVNITKNINITENNTENLECVKNESQMNTENSMNSKKIHDIESTTEIIIKTNAYLSDEKFINVIELNPSTLMNIDEYQMVKKRDLKSLKSEKIEN